MPSTRKGNKASIRLGTQVKRRPIKASTAKYVDWLGRPVRKSANAILKSDYDAGKR